jgi:hypothetical protein
MGIILLSLNLQYFFSGTVQKDKNVFSNVSLDHGVPVWMNGEIDIAPEVLYYDGVSTQ